MSIAGNSVRRLHGAPQRNGGVIGGNKLGSRVPAEFVGLARALRSRITSAYVDFDAGMALLLESFGGQNRSPLSRRTLLRRLPAAWRGLPEFGQLRLKIVNQRDGAVAV